MLPSALLNLRFLWDTVLKIGLPAETAIFRLHCSYRPYTAKRREESPAGGDPLEDFTNRSYFGKTNTAANEEDLDLVIRYEGTDEGKTRYSFRNC